jgi:UDP-N-acetylglucosamine 1-carboxyvinyltransferase
VNPLIHLIREASLFSHAKLTLFGYNPGGCAIGTRPVDLHLQGFKQLGADVRVCAETDTIVMTTAKQLTGAGDIHFRFPSVGATHSVMCAASLAIGVTTIHGAAAEPEVTDLAAMLNKCGARITGAGTSTIRIEGVSGTCRSDTPSQGQQSLGVERTLRAETLSRTSMSQTSQTSSQSVNKLLYGQTVMKHVSVIPDLASLLGCHHRAIPDRVEAGTLLVAAAVTLSSISVTPVVLAHLKSTMQVLESSGCTFSSEPLCETGKGFQGDDRLARLTIYPPKVVLKSVTFATAPFPGIPTDMQPQLCVLCAVAAGVSVVTETVFENRFGHVKELGLMSAMFGEDEEFGGYENDDADDTDKKNAKRSIRGSNGAPLTPRDVTGQDLRATAALVLAGLVCGDHDVTNVYGVTHLDRGYEQLDAKLNALGARITRRG